MANPWNPYEHHHDHGHGDCDHDHSHDADVLDPAQQSLADALRVSFGLLKWVMVVLMVLYVFSGVFTVKENEVAVRLAFGKIMGDATSSEAVLMPGGPYWSWPYPINDVKRIKIVPQTVELTKDFWFEVDPRMAGQTLDEMAGRAGPLNPERDGSLLTGDASIGHARWAVNYRVDAKQVPAYLRNVAESEQAQRLVSDAAQQGIVFAVAQVTADRLNKGLNEAEIAVAVKHAQETLDAIESGLVITNINQTLTVFPVSVRDAFQAVVRAESEKAQVIDQARGERTRILGEAAGEAADLLAAMIHDYELAFDAGDREKLAMIDQKLDEIFVSLSIPRVDGAVAIGGKVAQTINDAVGYRTRVVEQVRADAEYFTSLLPQYQENPRIVMNRIWQNAREAILSGEEVEAFYTPNAELYLETNRDPRVAKQRIERQLREGAERRREANQAER